MADGHTVYRVLFDFVAEGDGELTVRIGEELVCLEEGGDCPEGWLFVRKDLGDGDSLCGYVPRDFLEVAPDSRSPPLSPSSLSFSPAVGGAQHQTLPPMPSSPLAVPREVASLVAPPTVVDISQFLPRGSPTSTPMVHRSPTPTFNSNSNSNSYARATASSSSSRYTATYDGKGDLMGASRQAEALLEQLVSAQSDALTDLNVIARQAATAAQSSDDLLRNISLLETALDSEVASLTLSIPPP